MASDALLRDFERAAVDGLNTGVQPDWANWSHRLAVEVASLLEVTGSPSVTGAAPAATAPAASHVRSDLSAHLAPADTMLALAALTDATEYRSQHNGPGDQRMTAQYSALRYRLGDTR